MINDFHRLLRRQIKEHFGGLDKVPESLVPFLSAINSSYVDYDKDLEHVERILKISSQELFKSNKELNALNARNEQIIQDKTRDLRRASFSLQNAEKISLLGNFSWHINTDQLEMSNQFAELLGISPDNLKIDINQIFESFEDSEQIKNAVYESVKSKEKFSLPLVRLKQDTRYFQLEGNVFSDNETESGQLFIGVLKDNTATKLKELERDEIFQTLAHYKNAIDNAAIVSVTDEKGVITYVNERFCEISQYSEEQLLGSKHNVINSGFHPKEFFNSMWRQISSGETWKGIVKNKKKDGTFYWVDSTIVPFSKNGKIHQYISIRFDITDKINFQQKIEEQRSFYQTVLSSIPVDIAVFDPEHRYLFINPFAVGNPEVREFLIGKTDFDYCKHYNKDISIAEKRRALFNRAKSGNETVEFVDASLTREGAQVYMLRRFFPIFDSNSKLEYMLGFGVDITEKMQQSMKIAESLEEKEALLGEVHHRVKNNLALVMGLVEMQGARTDNEYVKEQLSEIQHRISAMALIHEKLYKSASFSKIDMRDYLQDFVKFLSGFFSKGKKINLSFDIDEIYATTKRAIPLALIVNELVTNSFKYAFKDKNSGEISVRLKNNLEGQELIIRDNGPGLPEGLNLEKLNSLGFKLLTIFTKQLKGKFEFLNAPGFAVKITFSHEQEGSNS